MKHRALPLVAVLCILAASCGDDSTSPPATTVAPATPAASSSPAPSSAPTAAAASDGALAASLLMGKDDFPRDYLEKKHVALPATDAISACRYETQPSANGVAATDDWLFDGQSPAIIETVTVFASAADAAARIASAPAFADCIVKAIDDGKFDVPDVTLSGASSMPITLTATGETTVGFAIQATQTFAAQTLTGLGQYTIAMVARGRVVAELFVRGSGTPFDPEELSDFLESGADLLPN